MFMSEDISDKGTGILIMLSVPLSSDAAAYFLPDGITAIIGCSVLTAG